MHFSQGIGCPSRPRLAALILLLVCSQFPVCNSGQDGSGGLGSYAAEPIVEYYTNPPSTDGPVVVHAAFHLKDVNEIDEEAETFEFTGVLTLRWHDKRRSFDPDAIGIDEKVYQGPFQFYELSQAWYPQVVLSNTSGMFEKSAVVLRVQPDGSCTLIETINATAETKFNLRRIPFDSQRLEAVFEVLGFDRNVVMLIPEERPKQDVTSGIRIPQWVLQDFDCSVVDLNAPYDSNSSVSSAFVLSVNVKRHSLFLTRLVLMPLFCIVVLSWAVFWMDRSSIGDRVNLSFVGILTAVTYQIVVGDIMPQISYVTLMNGFLNISFWLMCAVAVMNLVIGAAHKSGDAQRAIRLDRRCRFAFPLLYLSLVAMVVAIAFLWQ